MTKKILIIGGGNIGLNLAKMLEENFQDLRIKIIEKVITSPIFSHKIITQ